jgi:NADH dehydrogenase/NADH:ubiquinone oxidoreductase subunit G
MPESPAEVHGVIDGLEIAAPFGATILEAARRNAIPIPTLCHHEGLPPDGGCRLCLVELSGKLVASCQYPLRSSGFEIQTMSVEAKKARRFVISLMLARAPKAKRALELAEEYGVVPDPRLQRVPADGCLRCGLCARACAAVGAEAISLAGRGAGREVSGPFRKPPEDCLGCLACARICPTGAVKFQDDGITREVFGKIFELKSCEICGRPLGTLEEISRPFASGICPECRRRAMAGALGAAPAPSS